MNTTPAVSVIMPVYNAADFLDAAIDSVLRQTFADFELICFNDASTDSSLEILRHRAASDSRIKIIDSPRNVRQGAGRNAGIRAARGSFIFFMDADDALRSDTLEKCLNAADKETDLVSFSYCNWRPATGRHDNVCLLGADAPYISAEELRRRYIVRTTPIWCSMYSKKLFFSNDLWFPEGVFYEDNAIALALQLSASKPKYINEPLYLYRQDNTSVTRSNNNPHFFDRISSAVTLLQHLRRLGIYGSYKNEIDFAFINQYLVHTVFGAIYRFDSVQTHRIAEVRSGINHYIENWRSNPYWRSQPFKKRLKYHIHTAIPRTIKLLSRIKQRL